jgi:hypothetical protein
MLSSSTTNIDLIEAFKTGDEKIKIKAFLWLAFRFDKTR